MSDLDNQKKARKTNRYERDFPQGILDIIETDYPDRYALMLDDGNEVVALFSKAEWLDILTKSRNSFIRNGALPQPRGK